jgi:replication fork protection complex subunit Tof1/Swi1
MPRMLERYSSNKEHLFIRARARVKRAKARGGADEADLAEMQQDANERAEATYQERRFEFARFQNELCKPEVADASLNYLARWRDYSTPAEQLASVVGIMHRIAVKAGRHDLFFPHDVRQTLKALLSSPMVPAMEATAPTTARDAKKLIEYILKRYEKLTPEQQTKYAMGKGRTRELKAKKMPREIHVSPTRGHVGDVGIAVGLLAKLGKVRDIMWVKEALELASAERTEIVLSTDGAAARARSEERDDWDDLDRRRAPQSALDSNHLPSDAAVAKFTSFIMSYPNAEVANDGCMLSELKMLCRLVGLESESSESRSASVLQLALTPLTAGEDKMRWIVPAEVPPAHLDAEVAYIEEFMRSPYDTEGAELRSFVRVVPKPRAKKTAAERDADEEDPSGYDTYGSGVVSDNDDGTEAQNAARSRKEAAAELRKSRKRKPGNAAPRPRKKKAGPTWTAGDFIEDSDEEMAQAQAILDARANAALAAEANASRAAAISDSDSGSSASTRRRARGPARPRPTALARMDGTHVSPARSTPSRAGSTPPTSSPARDSPAPAKTRKLRPSGGLFFGGMDSDEEDAAMSDAELRADSPSPAVRSATQVKRPAMLESDDEASAQEESAPTAQLAKRRRAAVLDSDDE